MATNVMFGSTVRTVKDASGNVVGLSAGGSPVPPVGMSKKLAAAIRPLAVADQSLQFFVAGDSTGNDSDEWAYLLATALAAKYPAHTHDYRIWNDTSQQYDDTVRLNLGAAGPAYAETGAAAASWRFSIADGATTSPTGDLDVRAYVRLNGLPSAQATIASKYGSAGQRSWSFEIKTDGNLYLTHTADGTTAITKWSTTPLSGAQLTDWIWVRCTLDVDNGASGNTGTFYVSNDGITWTTLSAETDSGTTSVFDSTSVTQFIGRSGGSLTQQTNAIRFSKLQVFASLTGASRIVDIDLGDMPPLTTTGTSTFVDRMGNTVTATTNAANGSMGGSPALLFSNGSKGGSTISYHSDGTRYPKLVHGAPNVAIINHGHNDGTNISFRTAYKVLTDLLIASNPDVAICALTQNQRGDTSDYVREHRIRIRNLVDFAGAQGWDVIDTWPHVTQAMHPVDDPVHPDATGKLVQSRIVNAYFGIAS